MQPRNFTEYYLCTMTYYEIVFSTSNEIPQTQNLRISESARTFGIFI